MSARWFRVYGDLVDDPKVQRLNAETFRNLVNLWCLASQNKGRLPSEEDCAFRLRLPTTKIKAAIDKLRAAGLIDDDENGAFPHNWKGRQFVSDDPTPRVQAFRKRQAKTNGNVSETFHPPLPKRREAVS